MQPSIPPGIRQQTQLVRHCCSSGTRHLTRDLQRRKTLSVFARKLTLLLPFSKSRSTRQESRTPRGSVPAAELPGRDCLRCWRTRPEWDDACAWRGSTRQGTAVRVLRPARGTPVGRGKPSFSAPFFLPLSAQAHAWDSLSCGAAKKAGLLLLPDRTVLQRLGLVELSCVWSCGTFQKWGTVNHRRVSSRWGLPAGGYSAPPSPLLFTCIA